MTAPAGLVASTVWSLTVTTGGVMSLTLIEIVSTNAGPPDSPFRRNVTVHVIVWPCGALAETTIVSVNDAVRPLVNVCVAGARLTLRFGLHGPTVCETVTGRFWGPARIWSATGSGSGAKKSTPFVAVATAAACPKLLSPSLIWPGVGPTSTATTLIPAVWRAVIAPERGVPLLGE